MERAQDWLAQAVRDLEQAVDSRNSGRHEWACFAAQQAAEKAVKALQVPYKRDLRDHMVAQLLRELPEQIPVSAGIIHKALVLDNFYIPTRYPNLHPSGPPFEHYGPLQSEQAVTYARVILEFASTQMAES